MRVDLHFLEIVMCYNQGNCSVHCTLYYVSHSLWKLQQKTDLDFHVWSQVKFNLNFLKVGQFKYHCFLWKSITWRKFRWLALPVGRVVYCIGKSILRQFQLDLQHFVAVYIQWVGNVNISIQIVSPGHFNTFHLMWV